MSARASLPAVAIALVMTGCASTPPIRIASCNVHQCHVVVAVTDCHISLDPPHIELFGSNREIHWDIDRHSTGYTFAEDGIVIKDFDPKREFTDPKRTNQNTKFIWHDRNSFPHEYDYGVKVMNGETACRPLDPTIYNRG